MVSFSHEFLVELFRNHGELAATLLRFCTGMVFEHERTEQRSIDLSQVVSTEYRADAVVELQDGSNTTVAAVIVEVQLKVDHDKEGTWPVYVTALHHKLACPVVLIVVTPSGSVADWARRPIHLGHPGFTLTPVVMELKDVPRIIDPEEAQKLPELAVLSAMANPDLEVVLAALSVISPLPEERARLYWDVIWMALPPSVRKALETHMQGYVYQSEFARKYISQGREEGREEGLRRAVLAIVRAKLGEVTADDEAAIAAVTGEHALAALIDALMQITDAPEVRAAMRAAGKNR